MFNSGRRLVTDGLAGHAGLEHLDLISTTSEFSDYPADLCGFAHLTGAS